VLRAYKDNDAADVGVAVVLLMEQRRISVVIMQIINKGVVLKGYV